MRPVLSVASLAYAAVCAVSAAAVLDSGKTGNAPFKLDFEIHRGSSTWDMARYKRGELVKRDGLLEMELKNENTFYLTELKFGSNENTVGVLVDTGSSDLWIMSHDLRCEAVQQSGKRKRERLITLPEDEAEASNKASNKGAGQGKAGFFTTVEITEGGGDYATASYAHETNTCTQYGSFATANSDSFKRNLSAPPFSIQYADGTDANGVWGYDDIIIGNTTVKSLSFAVANETSSNVGVLGIGLIGLEVTSSFGSLSQGLGYTYLNLPLKLKDDGIIHKNVFSLYLGKESDDLGLILFGAVDSAKYSGTLQTVPMVNSYSQYTNDPIRIEVALTSMEILSGSGSSTISSKPHAVVLDTGSTFSYLFDDMVSNVASAVGARYSSAAGAYVMNCIDDDNAKITLDFSGVKIDVPVSAVQTRTLNSGNTCLLTLLPQSSSRYVLFGDNILRHMYIVYDLDDFEVSFAQVKFTSDENVEVISSTIPLALKAPDYSLTSVATDSDETVVSGSSIVSGSSSSGSSNGSGRSSGASTVGVPLLMAFVAIGSLLVVLC